jgi:predicted ATPase
LVSALWAGQTPSIKSGKARRLSIGFADDVTAYELRLGLPSPPGDGSPFSLDPQVKEETIRTLGKPHVRLLERRKESVMLRDEEGRPQTFAGVIDISESVLSQLAEPHRYPVLSILRERLRRWRFYHQIRTDQDSPLRSPQIGTRTPVMAHDGRDLAAALETIRQNGNDRELDASIAEAFDGASLVIDAVDTRLHLALQTPGVFRPMDATELSDGTLRYLALLAALRTPRPPELLVFNEPETSLHPRLLAPLGRQIIEASKQSQIIVVSHAQPLVDAIAAHKDATRIDLVKIAGATTVANRRTMDEPSWKWTS